MGTYTKVNLCLPIRKDVDENTKNILLGMFEGNELADLKEEGLDIPDHNFFKTCSRIWFPNSGGSYYFTGTCNSSIHYDILNKYAMVLYIDSDSKVDYEDVYNFLDWITPYLDVYNCTFLGYSICENDSNPVLYWYINRGIINAQNNNLEGIN